MYPQNYMLGWPPHCGLSDYFCLLVSLMSASLQLKSAAAMISFWLVLMWKLQSLSFPLTTQVGSDCVRGSVWVNQQFFKPCPSFVSTAHWVHCDSKYFFNLTNMVPSSTTAQRIWLCRCVCAHELIMYNVFVLIMQVGGINTNRQPSASKFLSDCTSKTSR